MPALTGPALPIDLLQRLASAAEMRRMDRHAIDTVGLPARVLMENAGQHVALRVAACLRAAERPGPVVVCCGKGNNGGDGYVTARLLSNQGFNVSVVRLGPPKGEDAEANAAAWDPFGNMLDWEDNREVAAAWLSDAVAIVDAIFGTGLQRPVEGQAAEMIAQVNASPAPVKVAVDVPSGIDSDTGQVQGTAVVCTHTVSFQVGKPGCYQYPGAAHAGAVEVAPISVPVSWEAGSPATYRLTEAFAARMLPQRPPQGHKGTFGHLLAVCGSAGMGGAALMAGMGALKTGAGLVTVAVPRALRDGFLAAAPELMTLTPPDGGEAWFEENHAGFVLGEAAGRTAAVLGCGVGRHEGTGAFVRRMVAELENPLVVDADGLFHLTPDDLQGRAGPTIVTPHPGELARLSGIRKQDEAADRVGVARRLAEAWRVVLVLKGAATVIASPGGDVFLNPTGDSGLASGGTGDVLTGIIGGLLAQGLPALRAALLGVFLHGLARDVQRESTAAAYFTARDVIAGINPALQRLERC